MTNKEQYAEWVTTQERLPIFMQPWWLDAVCAGKKWDVLLIRKEEVQVEEAETDIVAALPYLLRERTWAKYILMPQQTQIGGLYLSEQVAFTAEQLETVTRIVATHLQQLGLSYYAQKYPIGSPVPQFLHEHEFKIEEQVTYRIEDLKDLDKVIDRFSKNKKRQLQKALSLHVANDMTAEQFYKFHSDCMQLQRKQISYQREFFLVLERKTSRRQQSQILVIRNADGVAYAAAFVVWDKQSMYYLIPCYDPQYKDSGASALLVLEAIKLAREQGVAFDFEGSMVRGVAQHYKQFGSTKTTYYKIEKYYKWWFHFATFWNWCRGRKY